jgi:ribosomal-protein-alanine N-acetyltransferase
VVDKQSNRLVGCISCFLNKSELELFLIAVHPDFRNQGIGGAMLEYVSTKAIEHGWSLSTQVLASNVIAMNLYTKYGFKVDGGEAVLHRWKEKVN